MVERNHNKEEPQNLGSHGSPQQNRASLFMVGSQEHNSCRSGLHDHKQQNGIMRQLEIQIVFKGIQYLQNLTHKRRKHTMSLPTFVPRFPQVVVQSRWEIPVSQRHHSMFPSGASTGCLSSVLGCAHDVHQKPYKCQAHCHWLAKLHVRLLKVPVDHRTSPAAVGSARQSPSRQWEAGNKLWQGWARRCVGPARAACPQHCSVTSAAHICSGEGDSWEPRQPQSTLRNGHVHITTLIHCPNQLYPLLSFPSLRHHHLLCSGSCWI